MTSLIIVLSVIVLALCATDAKADGSVSDYLKDGWVIKAVTQQSTIGYTQIILQKDNTGVICTIFYSAKENKWTRVGVGGCDPLP